MAKREQNEMTFLPSSKMKKKSQMYGEEKSLNLNVLSGDDIHLIQTIDRAFHELIIKKILKKF